MTTHIYLCPGETIAQALAREGLDATPPLTLPLGASIHGPEIPMTRFIVNRKEEE